MCVCVCVCVCVSLSLMYSVHFLILKSLAAEIDNRYSTTAISLFHLQSNQTASKLYWLHASILHLPSHQLHCLRRSAQSWAKKGWLRDQLSDMHSQFLSMTRATRSCSEPDKFYGLQHNVVIARFSKFRFYKYFIGKKNLNLEKP